MGLFPDSLMGTMSVRESHPALRRESERSALRPAGLRNQHKRYSLTSSTGDASRSPSIATIFANNRDGESVTTARAWTSVLSLIQRKEYPFYIAAGTNSTNGTVIDAAHWFLRHISSLSFDLGSSPFCLNDLMSPLHSIDSPDFLVIGICVATYQGKPSKNAEAFVTWLNRCRKELQRGNLGLRTCLRHVHYFVFSVGQSEWKDDYQRV